MAHMTFTGLCWSLAGRRCSASNGRSSSRATGSTGTHQCAVVLHDDRYSGRGSCSHTHSAVKREGYAIVNITGEMGARDDVGLTLMPPAPVCSDFASHSDHTMLYQDATDAIANQSVENLSHRFRA